MSPEARSGPFITDSRSITPDQMQAIAGITGGVVATSDHDFCNILYLKYGHPTMHWHNPAIEVEEDRVTLVSGNWNSRGDRLVITRDTIQLVIQRPADPLPQGPSPLV